MRSVNFSYAQTATVEFNKIFENKRVFENPKNPNDIKRLIEYVTNNNNSEIILDFFAGSASTAHAVMQQNIEDCGNRKFICVQLPEETNQDSEAYRAGYRNIAEISKERIRRSASLIKNSNSGLFQSPEKTDFGFKVFKLQPSNFKIWNANIELSQEAIQGSLDFHVENINPGTQQESILFEILLKAGFELTTPIEKIILEGKTVFSIEDGEMLVCLDKELTHELIKAIAEKKPTRVICLDEGFQNNDQLKTNAVQIMKSKNVLNFRTV